MPGNGNQKGVVLMVALIIIFMMSLLGISALRGSSLEYQMAVNAIQTQDVLQAAESATDAVLNDAKVLTETYDLKVDKKEDNVIERDLRSDIGMTSSVTLIYIGDGNAVGASMDASQGANSFDALRFEAKGIAKIEAVNAKRQVNQGASRNVPR